MAVEQGWERYRSLVVLSPNEASALIGEHVSEVQPFAGGRRNSNYRLVIAGRAEPAVLRLHTARSNRLRSRATLAGISQAFGTGARNCAHRAVGRSALVADDLRGRRAHGPRAHFRIRHDDEGHDTLGWPGVGAHP